MTGLLLVFWLPSSFLAHLPRRSHTEFAFSGSPKAASIAPCKYRASSSCQHLGRHTYGTAGCSQPLAQLSENMADSIPLGDSSGAEKVRDERHLLLQSRSQLRGQSVFLHLLRASTASCASDSMSTFASPPSLGKDTGTPPHPLSMCWGQRIAFLGLLRESGSAVRKPYPS